jgi:acyl carrier protein
MTIIDPATVRQFLVSKYSTQILAMGLDPSEIPNDFDFFVRGIIDSFGILEMISSVEDEFGVRLDLAALDPEQLTVLGSLIRYIAETAQPT